VPVLLYSVFVRIHPFRNSTRLAIDSHRDQFGGKFVAAFFRLHHGRRQSELFDVMHLESLPVIFGEAVHPVAGRHIR